MVLHRPVETAPLFGNFNERASLLRFSRLSS